jgi:RHS repeat-associated protein
MACRLVLHTRRVGGLEINYDAWGNVTLDTNPEFVAMGYARGVRDAATELVRFGGRGYEPSVGRWTYKDPIGFADGSNLFAYVGNRPSDLSDSPGLGGVAGSERLAHHYNCEQTQEILEWVRQEDSGLDCFIRARCNHSYAGACDVKRAEPLAEFTVKQGAKPLSADSFGNFLAGYVGVRYGLMGYAVARLEGT